MRDDLIAEWVADARVALKERANATDVMAFETMVHYARLPCQRSIDGKLKMWRKRDVRASEAVVDVLAMILSRQLGWTRSFWSAVAYAAAKGE